MAAILKEIEDLLAATLPLEVSCAFRFDSPGGVLLRTKPYRISKGVYE